MPKPVPKYKPLKSSPIRPPPYRCDYCGIKRRLVRHHLRGRGWDGADSDENIAWVCGRGNESGCHGILHNNPSPRHDNLSFHGQDVPKKMRVIPGNCPICKEKLYWNREKLDDYDGIMYLWCENAHMITGQSLELYLDGDENG